MCPSHVEVTSITGDGEASEQPRSSLATNTTVLAISTASSEQREELNMYRDQPSSIIT